VPPADVNDTPSGEPRALRFTAGDGASADLLLLSPPGPTRHLLYWLPALGVAAKHYLPLAAALAERGVAVALHEWRGLGSSDRRAGRDQDWGYRELLEYDLAAGLAAARAQWPDAPCLLGGHSLGGQLAALHASIDPAGAAGLVLVASGSPYWRCFRHRWLIRAAYVLAPTVADVRGYLPGRRIGFGGNEARGVIRDWARSGRRGRYAAAGMPVDFERRLATLTLPILALRPGNDWLAPAASLEWLLAKMPRSPRAVVALGADTLGAAADHFSWMRAPSPVADRIAAWLEGQDAAFAPRDRPRP
jgi:predicted alpha/beta hydrolase